MTARRPSAPRRATDVRLALLAGALLLLAGCRQAPEEHLPEGTLWAGDARSARSLLAGLEAFSGSPAAAAATALGERLASCREFLAACPPGPECRLAAQLACEPAGALAARVGAARGGADWLFASIQGESRLVAWGTERSGRLVVRAKYRDGGGTEAPWKALLPARRAPAPGALSTAQALLHLHLRSDRALEALAAMGSGDWADRLFSLRRDLFAAMALEGTAEVAAYMPREGEIIPPLALALHVRDRERAVTVMEELLARVRRQWTVTPTRWSLAGREGACLADLRVLPELAPCYLAGDRQLLVGWNERSLRLALAHPPGGAVQPREGGGGTSELTLYLDRFAAADSLLARAHRDPRAPDTRYPWSRIHLAGRRGGGAYLLQLEASPGRGPGA